MCAERLPRAAVNAQGWLRRSVGGPDRLGGPGQLICSTPYHGYLKNLALSLVNKWDDHHNPLWDGGHIKFFSRDSLTRLLREAGLVNISFRGAGRLPYLWKSMVLAADRPAGR